MFESRANRRLGAAILVAVPVLVVVSLTLGMASGGDGDVFEREGVDGLLESLDDNAAAYFTSVGLGIAADVVALGVAAVVYLMFRDRNRLLALLGMVGVLGAAIGGFGSDVADLTLGILADDFTNGGATGVAARDPVILEVARAVGVAGISALQIAWMALGSGLIALGTLISLARAGTFNPPRWLGWWAIVVGLVWYLTWLAAVSDAALVFVIVGLVGTESWVAMLGVWLLRQPDPAPV